MKNSKKHAVYALDVFIVLLLLFSIGGAAVRAFIGSGTIIGTADEDYYVSYIICNADSSLHEYFSEGAVFYTEDGDAFGTVADLATSTPARIYTEDDEGKFIKGYADPDTNSNMDISGTFAVKGTMQEDGFRLSGDYLASGMKVKVYCSGAATEILITDITKAS